MVEWIKIIIHTYYDTIYTISPWTKRSDLTVDIQPKIMGLNYLTIVENKGGGGGMIVTSYIHAKSTTGAS